MKCPANCCNWKYCKGPFVHNESKCGGEDRGSGEEWGALRDGGGREEEVVSFLVTSDLTS